MTPEQCATENVIIMFILKDEDLMGIKNELISHAFVNFKDIPTTSNDLENTPQIRLNLTSPISLGKRFILLIIWILQHSQFLNFICWIF